MTFQALRVHLNDEFGEMARGMRAAFKMISSDGGRIGVITWKFSERKILDSVVNALEAVRPVEPLLEWYRLQPGAPALPAGPSLQYDEVVRPSEREVQRNSRARQGLLHVLRKRTLPRLAHLEKRAYALSAWAQVVAPGAPATPCADGAQRPAVMAAGRDAKATRQGARKRPLTGGGHNKAADGRTKARRLASAGRRTFSAVGA